MMGMRTFVVAGAAVVALTLAAVIAVGFMQGPVAAEELDMSENIRLIEDFVAAFNAKDVEKIMGMWGPEPVYHNMPGPPVEGTEAVRNLIESFVNPAEKIDWEILNIAASGDTVLAERIDRFVLGGKDIALPCNGAFEIKDGKISVWRDYFDMATWQRQMGQ